MRLAYAVVAVSVLLSTSEVFSAQRSRIVRPQAPKTSAELIDETLRRGEIDADTALLYQVFTDFDDPRLPARFRSPQRRDGTDSLSLAEAALRFDSLSNEHQDILAPFLRPPFHQGSWASQADQKRSSKIVPNADPLKFCGPVDTDDWSFATSISGRLRVWWKNTNRGDATVALSLASSGGATLDKFETFLERKAHHDNGSILPCRGGSDAIDVALVDAHSQTVPYSPATKNVPAFILLERNATDGTEATLAHELFHVMQLTYEVKAFSVFRGYKWLMEATAQWAQDLWQRPKDDGREQRAAQFYLHRTGEALDTEGKGREYGVYLLFLYLSRSFGDKVVKWIWDATVTHDSLEAINSVIPGGFEARWPEFALFLWNRDPVDKFNAWDTFSNGAVGSVSPAIPNMVELVPIDLPRLSAMYYSYVFDNPAARYVTFYNGLTYKLSKKNFVFEGEDWGQHFFVAEADEQAKQGAKVQALIKIGGRWRTEDWSNRSMVTFCRELPAEDIQELVLIYSNSQFSNRERRLKHQVEPPHVVVSDMACFRWKGDITYKRDVITPAEWIVRGKNLVFENTGGRMTTKPDPVAGSPILGSAFIGKGTVTFEAKGTADGCTYSGSESLTLTSDPNSGSFIYLNNNAPPTSEIYRTYWAAGSFNRRVEYTESCPEDDDGPTPHEAPVGVWLLIPLEQRWKVDGSGTKMSGSGKLIDGDGDFWEWNLTTDPP